MAALAAVALLTVRSWRIDYPYSIDFQTYWLAGQRVAAGEASRLYEAGGGPAEGIPLELAAGEFKNLPIVAVPFAPFASLPYLDAKRVFWWLGFGAIVVGGALAGIGALSPGFGSRTARASVGIALTALLSPAHSALRHGQTTPLVMLALAAWLYGRDRSPAWSGGSLGLACLVKFPPLALLALDAVRVRLKATAVAVATVLGAVALSVVAFGVPLHRAYLANVGGNAGTVMTGHNNQSLVAILVRLLVPVPVQDWTPRPLPEWIGAGAAMLTLVLFALAARTIFEARRSRADDLLEVPLVATLGIVALPVAWDHYVLLAAPAILALLGGLHEKGLLSRPRYRLAFATAFLVLALPTPTAWLDGSAPAGFLRALALSGDGLALLVVFGTALVALRVHR
jgi:hypothetical protein